MTGQLFRTIGSGVLLYTLSFFLLSCERVQPFSPKGLPPRSFIASFSDDTKASLSDGAFLIWHAGDSIDVFESLAGLKYGFDGSTGDIRGTFSLRGETPQAIGNKFSHIYALYPYSSSILCESEGAFNVSVHSLQHYTANSFDPDANLMAAVTQDMDDPNLQFSNILGYLRVKLYGGDILKSITINGNDGEIISGPAALALVDGQKPIISMTGNGTEITLDCGDGIALPETEAGALSFWIALPPVTFEKGFSMELVNSLGDKLTKTTSSKVEIIRNNVTSVKPICFRLSGGTDFLSFGMAGEGNVTYNAYDLTGPDITVAVPFGFDLTTAKAIFSMNGAQVTVNGIEQVSGVTENDFSDYMTPLQFKVTGISGLEKTYSVRVIDTKIPVVYVTTPGHQPITSKEVWIESATMTSGKPGEKLVDYGTLQIRGRGNTSWSQQDKKPYAIKLDKKKEVFGMPKHKRWNLQSCYGNSQSFFRDEFLFEVARRTASHGWAPHGCYVDVILNGKYIGLYWLCEKISVDENRVNIPKLKPKDVAESKITGGYLMEFASGEEEFNFYSDLWGLRYDLKNPDEDVPQQQKDYIKNYINQLEVSLKDDDRFAQREYADYLDVDSWIDYWFMHEIANGTDINLKGHLGLSCFCFKERGGKLKAGPVWDMHMYAKHKYHADTSLYYKRLFEDPAFVSRVKEKWYGTTTEAGFEERQGDVLARIDSIAPLIQVSGDRDLAIWGKAGSVTSQADNIKNAYNSNVLWLKNHIK